MDEWGWTPKTLTERRIVGGDVYTVEQLAGIYGLSLNMSSYLALVYGNWREKGGPKEAVRAISAISHHVEVQEPEIHRYVMAVMADFEENYSRLWEAVLTDQGRDMGKEANYIPMMRTEWDYMPDERQIDAELMMRSGLKKAYAERGFTMERKDISPEFQKPIRVDLHGIWLNAVRSQEHYIANAKLTKRLQRIAHDDLFKAAVVNVHGKEYLDAIHDYVNTLANPKAWKTSMGWFDHLSRRVRSHAAIAYLSYNVLTMLKQVPSTLYYLSDAGPGYLFSSAQQFAKDPMEMIRFVEERDPQVAHASIEREMEDLKARNSAKYAEIIRRFGAAGMKGIYAMDKVARTIGWNAVYQRARADLSQNAELDAAHIEAEAIRRARNATLRTQPAAAVKDVPGWYRSSELLSTLLMFTNQLNQMYNQATYDAPMQIKYGYQARREFSSWANPYFARAAMVYGSLAVSGLAIWSISNRRLPRDREDLADAMVQQVSGMAGFWGKQMMMARQGWSDWTPPIVEGPTNVLLAAERFLKGEADASDLDAALEGLAITFGIPYIQPKRVYRAATRGEPWELVGGEPRD